jgi:pSer/pThr/pTyr-binding forkhead associated (FHA) protein
MAKLHILTGMKEGHVFEINGDRVTVGRASDNLVCLPDGLISTYHATMIRDGEHYRLRDLNSTNHTKINGQRIIETVLNDNDIVEFGIVQARFEATRKAFVATTPMAELPPIPKSSTQNFSSPAKPAAPPPPATPTPSQPAAPVASTKTTVEAPEKSPSLAAAAPPLQPAMSPTAPKRKSNAPLVLGIVAGLFLVLLLLMCGVFVGRIIEKQLALKQETAQLTPSNHATTTTETRTTRAPEKPAQSEKTPEPGATTMDMADTMTTTEKSKPSNEMAVKPEPEKKTATEQPPAAAPETNATMTAVSQAAPTNEPSQSASVTTPPTPTTPAPTPTAPRTAPATPPKAMAPFTGQAPVVKPNPYDGQNVMAAQNQVDQIVFPKLQQLGITPASVCSDATFVRRVYLDVLGTLPTSDEARSFIEDKLPNKRNALVDKLLERDEYADYWAMKWCDLLRVKSEFPINLWPNAVQTYHQWIRTCLRENRPYDRFVRDMLTTSGSNFRDPPVNFYRAVQAKDPQTLAQAVGLTFMGVRTEKWPKERQQMMSTFFAQVGYKSTSEWKEEIVFFDPGKGTNVPSQVYFPDDTPATLPIGKDPRATFANWLITPQNPWFTQNIANRIWSWLFGRGIIHEPDDVRPDNPPVTPELLALLQRELVVNKYDLKAVYRLILKSKTYQLSSVPRSGDPRAEIYFAYYPMRRIEAEVMIDAINQITGTTEKYSSPIPEPFTFIPENVRSIALADGSISSPFLELFGRSPRATGMEVERNNRPTAAQQLHLLNSSHIQRKIRDSSKLSALVQQNRSKPRGVIDALYMTILSRYPTDEEVKIINGYNKSSDWNQRAWQDIAWALMNSAEFQHRH